MLEKLASAEHSSLLQKCVNYARKSLITLGPGRDVIKVLNYDLKGNLTLTPGPKVIKLFTDVL
jgi:hypothetical protein